MVLIRSHRLAISCRNVWRVQRFDFGMLTMRFISMPHLPHRERKWRCDYAAGMYGHWNRNPNGFRYKNSTKQPTCLNRRHLSTDVARSRVLLYVYKLSVDIRLQIGTLTPKHQYMFSQASTEHAYHLQETSHPLLLPPLQGNLTRSWRINTPCLKLPKSLVIFILR